MQLERFRAVAAAVPARRYSLANSAGICLGRDYSFDLVRPGLALYGGVPREEAEGNIRQVARVEAQIVQRRTIPAGESCGYGATFVAEKDTEAAILNIGYADGYLRGFSSHGSAFAGEFALPVLGRVSMDLIAVGCDAAPDLREGDWVEIDYDLPSASKQSGLSQYELLTTSATRFERRWVYALLRRRRLRLVAAEVDHRAAPAFGQPRLAGVAAVQDQPVVRVAAERLRHDLLELGFDLIGVLARREAGAVADAEDVRVDRERLLAERGVEHDIGGLAADAGQRLQLVARPRDLAAVIGRSAPGSAR